MGWLSRILGRSSKPAPLPMPGRPGPARSVAAESPLETGGQGALFTLGSEGNGAPAPPKRKIVRAPRIIDEGETTTPTDDGRVAIKAQPSSDASECKFMLSVPLLEGYSWWFESAEVTRSSPLAEQLFATGSVATVLLDESTVTVTHLADPPADWQPIAEEIGELLREHLRSDTSALTEEHLSTIPDERELREQIQQVIDLEVNPGVAAHSGHISLTRVRGNSIYIEMGGGCQGCSAADVTLKDGIHRSFRDAVPGVGAIYDDTDHAAGENPFFS